MIEYEKMMKCVHPEPDECEYSKQGRCMLNCPTCQHVDD
jgi:hypothetical protein